MRRELLFFVLTGIIIAGILIIPKETEVEQDGRVLSCNCLGLKSNTGCLGMEYSCMKTSNVLDLGSDGEEILIFLDSSLTQSDDLIFGFIDVASSKRKIRVYAMSADTELLWESSFEKELQVSQAPDTIVNYKPAFKLAAESFEESHSKKLVFISRVKPSDSEPRDEFYVAAEEAAKTGACIYVIDMAGSDILANIADLSSRVSACGGYFRADETSYDTMIQAILGDSQTNTLELQIKHPRALQYPGLVVPLQYSASVPSECSYSLNSGNTILLSSDNVTIRAQEGKNVLALMCRSYESDVEKSIEIEFIASGDGLKGMFAGMFNREKESRETSKEDFLTILRKAYDEEEVKVIRRAKPMGKGSIIELFVQNTKPAQITGIRVEQIIPDRLGIMPDGLTSESRFMVLESSPLIIEFSKTALAPEEVMIISYYVDRSISDIELESIGTEIRFDPLSDESIDGLFESSKNTTMEVRQSLQRSKNSTTGKLRFIPGKDMLDTYVYLDIPKCMALQLNKIYFKDSNYRVIADDPLILWHLDEINEEYEIEYSLDKKLEEQCEKQMSVITIGKHGAKDAKRTLHPAYAILIIPAIILFLIIYNRMAPQSRIRKSPYFTLLVACAVLFFLVLILYPKPRLESMHCDCFGVSYADTCYGSTYRCEPSLVKAWQGVSGSNTCNGDCDSLSRYIKTDPRLMQERGVDFTLIFDQSKSMEGEKMQQAKQASIAMLEHMKDKDRISVISFDNSSRMVRQFTGDRNALTEAIADVPIGFTTEYIPALERAYYNYLSNGDKHNRWMVIFLSDGEPGDPGKPASIYEKVRELSDEGLCISTIGYGEESGSGSNAEKILQEMAEISHESTGCGSYHYSPKSLDHLSDVMGRVYKELSGDSNVIQIEEQLNSNIFSPKEAAVIEARLFSRINNLEIPGSFMFEGGEACSPMPDVSLYLGNLSYAFSYNQQTNAFNFRSKLPSGEYDAKIISTIGFAGCRYHTEKDLGKILVDEDAVSSACKTDSCADVSRYLFTTDQNVIHVVITDYAFIPQNVSISDGTTIIWKNIGKNTHTVTSGKKTFDGLFHSGVLEPGEEFNITFEKAGAYTYFDNLSVEHSGVTSSAGKDISFGNFKLEYKKPIDLLIIVDASSSMVGSKMTTLKNAAMRLSEMVYPNDRIGLIEFSDDAMIGQTFTSDRNLIKRRIQSITLGGSTRYVPALMKAKELYSMDDARGKVIIFLSDGQPWDNGKPGSIYSAAEELITDGICIYAVGYGDDVYPGSPAEQLLKSIVDLSQSSQNCGDYKYAPADETRLIKIFGSLYHKAAGEVDALTVDIYAPDAVMDNETLTITALVKSTMTGNPFPGSMQGLCVPPAKIKAEIIGKTNTSVANIELQHMGATGYSGELSDIPAGKYKVVVDARACADELICDIKGSSEKDLMVVRTNKIAIDRSFMIVLAGILVCIAAFYWQQRD